MHSCGRLRRSCGRFEHEANFLSGRERARECRGSVATCSGRMEDEGISQELFDRVLLEPSQPDIPDGMDVLWREGEGLRIVILTNPTPNRGAKLVKTAYFVKPQARVPFPGSPRRCRVGLTASSWPDKTERKTAASLDAFDKEGAAESKFLADQSKTARRPLRLTRPVWLSCCGASMSSKLAIAWAGRGFARRAPGNTDRYRSPTAIGAPQPCPLNERLLRQRFIELEVGTELGAAYSPGARTLHPQCRRL